MKSTDEQINQYLCSGHTCNETVRHFAVEAEKEAERLRVSLVKTEELSVTWSERAQAAERRVEELEGKAGFEDCIPILVAKVPKPAPEWKAEVGKWAGIAGQRFVGKITAIEDNLATLKSFGEFAATIGKVPLGDLIPAENPAKRSVTPEWKPKNGEPVMVVVDEQVDDYVSDQVCAGKAGVVEGVFPKARAPFAFVRFGDGIGFNIDLRNLRPAPGPGVMDYMKVVNAARGAVTQRGVSLAIAATLRRLRDESQSDLDTAFKREADRLEKGE